MKNPSTFRVRRPPDPENKSGERMFENGVLESLTVTSPLFSFLVYTPVSAVPAWWCIHNNILTGLLPIISWWVAGFCFFTLAEYLIHRFLYHYIVRNKPLKRLQFLFHGFHHKHPEDRRHLFLPYLAGCIIMPTVFGIFYLFLGKYTFMFFSGFIAGYLSYIFVHYCIHKFQPPFKWLKPWWTHHLIHHSGLPGYSYAVQVIFWDKLFGTMPPVLTEEEETELLKHG